MVRKALTQSPRAPLVIAAAITAAASWSGEARADDRTGSSRPGAPAVVAAAPSAAPSDPPPGPLPTDDPEHPEHRAIPPSQPVPVPNPSPVVVGGEPTPEGTMVEPLVWRRRRFNALDATIMFTGGAITLATAIIPPHAAHVRGPFFFDEDVRDAIRVRSVEGRYIFRDASDVGLSLAVTWPFFIDALFSAWWLRGSRDVAEQMSLVSLETFAVSGALQGVTNTLVSRERPYGQNCRNGELPVQAIDCTSSSHFRSFFSGHSSFAFTSAALICFNHFELGLLGRPWDAISCAAAYGVAATTATFRVVSDMHYASDILTGAVLGTVVGYGVPLLHFRRPDIGTARVGSATMRLVPSNGGAAVVGIW